MNSNGSTLLEFLIVSVIIGTFLLYIFVLTVELIDRKHIEFIFFKTIRELALRGNGLKKAKLKVEELKKKIINNLDLKEIKIDLNVLENDSRKIKLQMFCKRKILFQYTYQHQILFYR